MTNFPRPTLRPIADDDHSPAAEERRRIRDSARVEAERTKREYPMSAALARQSAEFLLHPTSRNLSGAA